VRWWWRGSQRSTRSWSGAATESPAPRKCSTTPRWEIHLLTEMVISWLRDSLPN
jgi:hypothetical protein